MWHFLKSSRLIRQWHQHAMKRVYESLGWKHSILSHKVSARSRGSCTWNFIKIKFNDFSILSHSTRHSQVPPRRLNFDCNVRVDIKCRTKRELSSQMGESKLTKCTLRWNLIKLYLSFFCNAYIHWFSLSWGFLAKFVILFLFIMNHEHLFFDFPHHTVVVSQSNGV